MSLEPKSLSDKNGKGFMRPKDTTLVLVFMCIFH